MYDPLYRDIMGAKCKNQKKYSYKEIKEFNELETSINATKDFELSNELYDFKRKYL